MTQEKYNGNQECYSHEIEPGLFLGPKTMVDSHPAFLGSNDVKHILSIIDLPVELDEGKYLYIFKYVDGDEVFDRRLKVNHLHLPVDDYGRNSKGTFVFDQVLEEGIRFIENARQKNENIFVHCLVGRNRSATVVTTYLAKTKKITFEQALEQVKTIRSIVNPMPVLIAAAKTYLQNHDIRENE